MEEEQIPVTEDAPALCIEIEAADAPTVGGRMSVDYMQGEGPEIDVTWMAHDPDGAWIVTAVTPVLGTSRTRVWLVNPSRPDLPKKY